MRNKVHFILLAAVVALASSCGTSYSSTTYSDDIYYRPTAASRLARAEAETQRYIEEHGMINSYFEVDSATGRIYLRDGASYTDLLHKFDKTTYTFNLSFGGWYNPWNPWFDPWYRPWNPWFNPWYGPWDPWYRPWGPWWPGPYYPYYPGTIVVYDRYGYRTGSSSYGFGHRTDSGLRSGSSGTPYYGSSYSGGSYTHRLPSSSSGHRSSTASAPASAPSHSSSYSSSYSSRQGASRSSGSSGYSGSYGGSRGGYSGGYSGGGYSGGGYHGGGSRGGGGHR